MSLYDIFGIPFGYLMSFIYKIIPNYAVAIIVFTIVTRILLFPMSYKTQKNAARMQLFQPKIQKIQKSFANNPQRIQEETNKLYAEEGYNPMGSCLPSFIQMFLLFGVIDVVYKPITHILHITKPVREAAISKASQLVETLKIAGINNGHSFDAKNLRSELYTMELVEKKPAEFSSLAENFADRVSEFSSKFTIFGANLGKTPQFHPEEWTREALILFLIPWIAGIAQILVSVYSMLHQKKVNPTPQAGGGCMWFMMLGMPILTIVWGYGLPAGVGFYWIWSSLISFLVTFGLNQYFSKERLVAINEKEKEKARAYAEKHPEKKTFMQRLYEQQAALEAENDPSKRIDANGGKISRSEMNKQQRDAIKEARRRMAEKYGDAYEDEDND